MKKKEIIGKIMNNKEKFYYEKGFFIGLLVGVTIAAVVMSIIYLEIFT